MKILNFLNFFYFLILLFCFVDYFKNNLFTFSSNREHKPFNKNKLLIKFKRKKKRFLQFHQRHLHQLYRLYDSNKLRIYHRNLDKHKQALHSSKKMKNNFKIFKKYKKLTDTFQILTQRSNEPVAK